MTPSEIMAALLSVEGMATPSLTPLLTDEPKIPVYVTRIGNTWGQGAHPDAVVAQLKAAAEALERHCLLTPDSDAAVMARYGELEGQLNPADFYCYSRAQTVHYDQVIEELRQARRYWSPVNDVPSGDTVLVPREFLYLDARSVEESPIRRESISSGSAIGVAGKQDAFRRALFELIERDAFMGIWLRGEAARRIECTSGAAAELIALLDRYRLECRLFDMRNDLGVPVVLALTVDRTGLGPAVTTGLSGAERYDSAAESAILESLSYRRHTRLKMMSGDLAEIRDSSGIVSAEARIAYWSDLERLKQLPPWTEAPPAVSLRHVSHESCSEEQAVERLVSQGCRVMRTDITSPAARAAGFEAVRVIVPELHPLYLVESAMALHSGRRGSVAANATLPPHPFA